ncbi:FRRS1-like protein [Mya arenaria]|uniref:FRRS1-like protein n=1 Tax=Mya arenaria TaxID=6604 RepID=A0ABY7FPC2_MYAAR|nr:FRRS1-like protein [Mya arenaria]
MKFSTFIGVLLGVSCCHGYSLGPPLNACGAMFPWGHGVQARNDSPPFSFRLNSTSYSPGDVIEVFLNTSQEMFGDYFLEGALIQMRPVTCKSALRHYAHIHIYNRTFYWTAPSKPSGHLFIRATIARNQKNFWTNVYSDYILDKSGGTPANLNHCTTGGAVKLAVSSILAGFTIVLTLILL